MNAHSHTDYVPSTAPVDFLWLELTNQCNLQCTHCYAESGPREGRDDILSTPRYVELMTEAFALGCRRVQFIGGEPTLHRDLRDLVKSASSVGYEFIEVFTNLTRLSDELLQCFLDYGVRVATSVYGASNHHHDLITQVGGSFEKTTGNIRRLLRSGISVRASVIEMPLNAGQTDVTVRFLHDLGIENVGTDRIRRIGRGAVTGETTEMAELCGTCAGGTMCVSANGVVSPCIMSKKWPVGSVTQSSLSELATGNVLRSTRQQIFNSAVATKHADALCMPCQPHGGGCSPCSPMSSCPPTSCQPYKCSPYGG